MKKTLVATLMLDADWFRGSLSSLLPIHGAARVFQTYLSVILCLRPTHERSRDYLLSVSANRALTTTVCFKEKGGNSWQDTRY